MSDPQIPTASIRIIWSPGFGSGLNVPHYPAAVERVYAIDPSMRGRQLAAQRLAASDVVVEFVGLTGERLPLDDDSCDSAIVTFTLCTIPDHHAALAELRRVLRPGGTLHFLEHGLAEQPKVQVWQHRLTPIQRRLFDGCHLNRPMLDDIVASGFEVDWSESRFAGGPKPPSWFTVGRAINPA